jgi:transcriptional regulator with XRE-family HTH domain
MTTTTTTTKHGRLDGYVHSVEEEAMLAQEEAVAHVALQIAETLERSGFSQRQLANLVGVTEGRISQILGAESNPTVKTLAKIGHALGRRLCVTFADHREATHDLNARITRYRDTPVWDIDVEAPPESACTEWCAA